MDTRGLEEILKGVVDDMYTGDKGEVVLVFRMGRVVNMYLHGGNLSISLRKPDRILVIAGGRVITHDGGKKEDRTSAVVDGVFIDHDKLYITLKTP
mgnify:CR=1 FL=1